MQQFVCRFLRALPDVLLQELCHQVLTKWGTTKVALAHRIGVVEVCEPSVVIAISSPHRKDSLEVGFMVGVGMNVEKCCHGALACVACSHTLPVPIHHKLQPKLQWGMCLLI
jgi:hypothetical protein